MSAVEYTKAFVRHEPLKPLPPPGSTVGVVGWVKTNLFTSWLNVIVTVVALAVVALVLPGFIRFLFTEAVWSGEGRDACLADKVGGPVGACWPFVFKRIAYFAYGQYPEAERWRVNLTWILGAIGLVWLMVPRIGAKGWGMLFFFLFVPIAAFCLLTGNALPYALIGLAVGTVQTAVNLVGSLLSGIGWLVASLVSGIFGTAFSETVASLGYPVSHYIGDTIGALRDSTEAEFGPALAFWIDYGISALAVLAVGKWAVDRGFASGRTIVILGAILALIAAGIWLCSLDRGLRPVPTNLWGGMLVTIVVASVGIVVCLPFGIVLALGRRSSMPIAKFLSVVFIEFVRGVPMITVLLMANTMLPLFLPEGVRPDSLLRCLIGVALFSSAYMAEVVRGGLQAMPKGQYEGAMALGLNFPLMMIFVVLPQALKLVIPGIVNSFISLFKDTTLVAIVGILDFLETIKASTSDANWATPVTSYTGYAFAALVYWMFCFSMSRYSQSVERRLDTGHKR